jgi:hypothetical protein
MEMLRTNVASTSFTTSHSNRYLTLFGIRQPWPPQAPGINPREALLHNQAYPQGTVDEDVHVE